MSLEELKKALKEKKMSFGLKVTLKNIKIGKVSKIFLASNCPEDISKEIEHYAKLSGNIEVVKLKQPNDELAVICKKPFSLSVISY